MRRTEPGLLATLLLIAAFLGVCAVPVLVYQGFWAGFLVGDDAQAQARSDHLMLAALIVALVASSVGIAVGWWVRLTATIVVMTVVLAVAGSIALLAAAKYDPPTPQPGPIHCQEHSGGDNECPGD
ncbi:hypothetical protein [Cryptosporangium phraense]|uniref:DUF998 domain-containing protein n=1 Tax=Cryptosporangium phraense TaxID=2593070 RepID=A0A545AWE4_9ACTN|nr:hypothetical protein [Cryptosporangium phraense]TQS45643.1 hypothetical protein FL583_07915 [Cryptosporangium phraense]